MVKFSSPSIVDKTVAVAAPCAHTKQHMTTSTGQTKHPDTTTDTAVLNQLGEVAVLQEIILSYSVTFTTPGWRNGRRRGLKVHIW